MVPPPTGLQASVEQLLVRGLEHYVDGRLKQSVEDWQAALRLDPDNRRAREYLKSALQEYAPLSTRRADYPLTSGGPTAWDDGPSAAPSITLDTPAADHSLSHLDVTPPPEGAQLPFSAQRRLASLISDARERYALGDFSGALALLDELLALDPGHAEAVGMRDDCTETLAQMYESQLGSLFQTPRLMVNHDEIVWLNLDHRAGFVLAQIDGQVSYDDLYSICGMSRLDTARILAQLLGQKVIG